MNKKSATITYKEVEIQMKKQGRRRAWFEDLIADIVTLKIQGAENIAKSALKGVARYYEEVGRLPPQALLERLANARPTEPMLQNTLAYLQRAPGNPLLVIAHLLQQFRRDDEEIARYAAELLKSGKKYFTHCHSSTVVRAFLTAHTQGKRFEVHNTETRPRYQGRRTARELSKAGIPVVHGVDSAARILLKGCAAVFLGADALFSDAKIANKIGSEIIAELAHQRDIPVYILASSWKYAGCTSTFFRERLERRSPEEVWKTPPRGVDVVNDAFEFVTPRFITAIITEEGIRDPYGAVRELQHHHRLQKRQ